MTISYNKPHLTYEEQSALIASRDLKIDDPVQCLRKLQEVGYYRLSAYWYPFRKKKPESSHTTKYNYRFDDFAPGHTFSEVVELYDFDEALRRLLLEALGLIEIQLRAKVAYYAGQRDPLIHLCRSKLDEKECGVRPKNNKKDSYEIWLQKYGRQVSRSRQEDFIAHYKERYGSELPIWVVVEVMDFGSISKLFDFLPKEIKNQIAPSFGARQGTVVAGWMKNFNYVRNLAAHHSRLWNRSAVTKIQVPNRNVVDPGIFHLAVNTANFDKIYPTLALLVYTLSFLQPESDWRNRLIALLENFPQIEGVSLEHMGFPSNWRQLAIWRSNVTFINGAGLPPWVCTAN